VTGPRDPSSVPQAPHGATARRLDWTLLPPALRRLIETQLGSPVAEARSAGAGFTPGFASVLTGTDGRRQFVKAASTKAQAQFAAAYREEIRKLRALPPGIPAPRLLWTHDDDLWVVLGLEYVDGAGPVRPWRTDQLEACLDALEVVATRLDPAPEVLGLGPMAAEEEFGSMAAGWRFTAEREPDWPHLAEAEALTTRAAEVLAGSALVHTDARDDNFVVTDTGAAVLCDWNWPVLGPAWADTVMALISAHADGHDADAILARRAVTRDVDPEHVDVLLSLLCAYFLQARFGPVPPSSPFIRVHQEWYAHATWGWLAQRRGW
jgi:hypothetical protein